MKKQILFATLSILLCCAAVQAQTTAFTYQGRFTDASVAQPTNGTYQMQFALFDAGGAAVGTAITVSSVQVVNGIFTVQLDFGANAFAANAERLLEIRVFNPATAAYVPLSPRQPVTSAPLAIRSKTATIADNALAVGGTPAANIINDGDSRLTDSRQPAAGSANYIQNQNTAAQMSTNFSIDGTGAANVFNAQTQFNIGGSRVLGATAAQNTLVGLQSGSSITTGVKNVFAGEGAGFTNSTGGNNAFFGFDAGRRNTTGASNSFFGLETGFDTTSGSNNSFFGRHAGINNKTGNENVFFGVNAGFNNLSGNQNVFLGVQAGNANTTGSSNTIIGTAANVAANNLTFATALGAGASVADSNSIVLGRASDTVRIPGTLLITGTYNLPTNNPGYIQNTATQQAASNFNISGDGTAGGTLFANLFNSATQYNVNGRRALHFVTQQNNIFIGDNNGQTTAGGNNVYLGVNTGGYFNNSSMGFNTTGSNNTLIGAGATLGFPESNYRTAIGAGSRVNNDNTVALGRPDGSDTVQVWGELLVFRLADGPGVTLCRRNSDGRISQCSSSIRYKTNIAPFASGMNLINRLRPVTFDWKADGTPDVGFIAEEINAVEPLLTIYNDRGEVEGVKYDRLSVAFVNAFKEQQTQIAQQQRQIDELKQIVCSLKPDAPVCR